MSDKTRETQDQNNTYDDVEGDEDSQYSDISTVDDESDTSSTDLSSDEDTSNQHQSHEHPAIKIGRVTQTVTDIAGLATIGLNALFPQPYQPVDYTSQPQADVCVVPTRQEQIQEDIQNQLAEYADIYDDTKTKEVEATLEQSKAMARKEREDKDKGEEISSI